MPFLGKWIMLDDPFDDRSRQEAKRTARLARESDNVSLRDEAARLLGEAKEVMPDPGLLQRRTSKSKRRE